MTTHDRIILVTDGAARGNPGPAGSGYSIRDPHGTTLFEHAETIGPATNNEAEYRALIAGLERAASFTLGEVDHYTDSEVLAGHMSGTMKVAAANLVPLHARAVELKRAFRVVRHHAVRRSEPWIARVDAIVNDALDLAAAKGRGAPRRR